MYVQTSYNEIDFNQLHTDYDLLVSHKTAVANVKVNFISWENLKKSNTERISRIYTKIFGEVVFNPYEERFEMMVSISNWMQKQIIKTVNALAGISEGWSTGLSFFELYEGFITALATQKDIADAAAKRPVADNIVAVVTDLLAQGFTCAAIGNMELGISAKQASRIKRGRRYSSVTGIEERKPVARQYSPELAVFA